MTQTLAQIIASRRPWIAAALGVALSLSAGCMSMPRPVPTQQQAVAQASVAGVLVSVPRLDSGDFPGDVLDVSTAVLVVVENQSPVEVLVDPAAFSLGTPGGAQYSPIPAAQLAYKPTVNPLPADTMLAWGGRGSIGVRPAPAYRGSAGSMGGRMYQPAPFSRAPMSRQSYIPRSNYGRYPFGGYMGGPNFMYGYGGPGLWGGGYYGGAYWDGRAYAWSRADAQRLSLPSAKLPPGARLTGFLFFPRLDAQEGTALELTFTLRDSATGQPIGTAQLPLEMQAD